MCNLKDLKMVHQFLIYIKLYHGLHQVIFREKITCYEGNNYLKLYAFKIFRNFISAASTLFKKTDLSSSCDKFIDCKLLPSVISLS